MPRRPAAILALWCVTCPAAPVIAGGPDTSVTSDTDTAPPTGPLEGVGGRVTSAGVPVADVLVQARSLDGLRAIPDMAVVTDSAGRFFWKLTPGTYELTFMQEGRLLARRQVVVHPNRTTRLDVE